MDNGGFDNASMWGQNKANASRPYNGGNRSGTGSVIVHDTDEQDPRGMTLSSTFGRFPGDSATLQRPVKEAKTTSETIKSVLVGIATYLDVAILIVVAVIGGLMQWARVFDFHEDVLMTLVCPTDLSITLQSLAGPIFSDTTIYLVTFLAPLFVILVCELALYFFTQPPRKRSKYLPCGVQVPHLLRRLLRYVGTFLFGMFSLMVLINVIKMRMKIIRPNCQAFCRFGSNLNVMYNCRPAEDWLTATMLSTSFPSSRATTSMFAGVFTTMYLIGVANVYRSRSIAFTVVSISFVTLGFLFGVERYVENLNWWGDVVVGQIFGVAMALYLSIGVLHMFRYRANVTMNNMKQQMDYLIAIERNRESRETLQMSRLGQQRRTNEGYEPSVYN